jgi:hypothetical protein
VKKIYITIIAFILLIAPVFAKPYTTYPIGARNPYTIPMRSIAPMREYTVYQKNRSNPNEEESNGHRVAARQTGSLAKYRVTNIGGGIIPILSDEQLTFARTSNKSNNNRMGGRPGGSGVPDLSTPLEMSWDVIVLIIVSGLIYALWISKKTSKKKTNDLCANE